jgi:hypothetical protein
MSEEKKVKKKKRDLDKYPALNPRLNAKTRFEVLDMDYLHKLDDASLEWFNRAMGEYVSGAFKKEEDGSYSSSNLHQTVEQRRECYTRNNVRNRCAMTISNATGKTVHCDNVGDIIDGMRDIDAEVSSSNWESDFISSNYGEEDSLEDELYEQRKQDYLLCKNPVTQAHRKMAESAYGKMLFQMFEGSHLKKKD